MHFSHVGACPSNQEVESAFMNGWHCKSLTSTMTELLKSGEDGANSLI
jgi:hypothetical protein